MREAFCLADSGIGLATDITILAMLALSAWLVLRTGRI
jgi:branched-chain amino acid transport system permease protein